MFSELQFIARAHFWIRFCFFSRQIIFDNICIFSACSLYKTAIYEIKVEIIEITSIVWTHSLEVIRSPCVYICSLWIIINKQNHDSKTPGKIIDKSVQSIDWYTSTKNKLFSEEQSNITIFEVIPFYMNHSILISNNKQ